MTHCFDANLAFSLGERGAIDLEVIKQSIPGCVSVIKTDTEIDKTGIDYVATLRRGATINIDAKTRKPNSSKYWCNGEPELALEKWSVVPDNKCAGKVGWTLSESSQLDMVLYTFDKTDSDQFYLIPFQNLRTAFIRNMPQWAAKYGWKRQRSEGWTIFNNWKSEAMFVPASVVIEAVKQTMIGRNT